MTSHPLLVATLVLAGALPGHAGAAPAPLPFHQDWSDVALISTDDDWSGVAGVAGYRGDDLTTEEAADPRTIRADGRATPVDVIANRTNPAAVFAAGIAEFEFADPVVALRGSATADAPHLVLALDTTGLGGIRVTYDLRDVDASASDSIQPFALQYRVGGTGRFANVAGAFVADSTAGPGDAARVTAVDAVLPDAAADRPLVEVRIMTTNAAGADEWVGVDALAVSGIAIPARDRRPPALTLAAPTRAKLGRILRRGVRATTTINEPATLAATLRISRRLAARLGVPRVVGRANVDVDAGAPSIAVPLALRARRKLAELRRFAVALTVHASDEGGNATRRGAWITISR